MHIQKADLVSPLYQQVIINKRLGDNYNLAKCTRIQKTTSIIEESETVYMVNGASCL